MARDADVEHAVRFLGFIGDDESRALYRQALAHLLVSHAEGFGLTVVEAMAAGCPVVTTLGGSLGEIRVGCGAQSSRRRCAAAGAALVRLSQDGALRAQLRERGRERAQLFSRDVQAKAMVAAFLFSSSPSSFFFSSSFLLLLFSFSLLFLLFSVLLFSLLALFCRCEGALAQGRRFGDGHLVHGDHGGRRDDRDENLGSGAYRVHI